MTAAATPARKPKTAIRPRRPIDDGWREFVTPEGVDLRLKIGTFGERCAAFLIDVGIVAAALLALTLLLAVVGAGTGWKGTGEAATIIWLLGFFLAREAYFIGFELRPNGRWACGSRRATAAGSPPTRSSRATPCASWRCSCRRASCSPRAWASTPA
jgi:hypothetical protein